jgi:hypothetical protein
VRIGEAGDRGAPARALQEARIRAYLAGLVDEALIEEHRRRPVGHHSPALAEVLAFLRQAPVAGKLALVASVPGREWRVVRLSGRQGEPHEPVGSDVYRSEDEARHALFLRRLEEAGLVGGSRGG